MLTAECFLKNNFNAYTWPALTCKPLIAFPKPSESCGTIALHFLCLEEPEGLQILGNVGWRMGESLGPLVEREGRKVFLHKQETLEATPERIATLEKFRADLKAILRGENQDRANDAARSRAITAAFSLSLHNICYRTLRMWTGLSRECWVSAIPGLIGL